MPRKNLVKRTFKKNSRRSLYKLKHFMEANKYRTDLTKVGICLVIGGVFYSFFVVLGCP